MGELDGLFKALGMEFTDAELRRLFLAADANRDKGIDYQEFLVWLSGRTWQQAANLAGLRQPLPSDVTEFQTSCLSHTSAPVWNECHLLRIGDDDIDLIVSVFDEYNWGKYVLLHQFRLDPRPQESDQQLILRSGDDEHMLPVSGASTSSHAHSVELCLTLRPDISLRSKAALCRFMHNLTGEIMELTEHHVGETVV